MLFNIAFKIISALRKAYWFIRRPVTVGVKIIATSGDRVLLIKNRYEKSWYLPGGGVKGGETPTEGAKREMMEECGLEIADPAVFGIYTNFGEWKSDHIIVMSADIGDAVPAKGIEIEHIRYFGVYALPEEVSGATRRRIGEYLSGKQHTNRW